MVTSDPPCDRNRLKLLLAARAGDAPQDDLVRHLDQCQACQRQLELMAADPAWWTQARQFLGSEPAAQPSDTPEDPPDAVTRVELEDNRPKVRHDPAMALLEPSDNPAMLGRLDRYEVIDVIGRGGMGIVFRGHDEELNRQVAIKVLAPQLASNVVSRRRFTREARAAAAVVHPNVMPIHAIGSVGELPYLVMPYVAGQSLQARIQQHGPLDTRDVLRIGVQVAAGLAAAHAQGLVHRDIKPGNILLENGVERVMITDFGLARATDDADLTRSGSVAGTPHYMSPEQASESDVDQRSDLFSLGSVLYAMCTGYSPFRARTTMAVMNRICHAPHRPVGEVNGNVPGQLADVIDRLLAKDPKERHQTAAEVAEVLAEIRHQGPAASKIDGPADLQETTGPLPRSAGQAAGKDPSTRQAVPSAPSHGAARLRRHWRLLAVAVTLACAIPIGLLMFGGLLRTAPNRNVHQAQPAAQSGQGRLPGAHAVRMESLPLARDLETAPLGAEFTYDFRGGQFDRSVFEKIGINSLYAASSLIQTEQSGLRILIPKHQVESKPRLGIVPVLKIHGDFQITASYEILAGGNPGPGPGVGPNLDILAEETLHRAALRRCARPEGDAYLVEWSVTDRAGKRVRGERYFPAEGSSGKLGLVRAGITLYYIVADRSDPESRVLFATEFGSKPIGMLRLESVVVGARDTVEILWKDLAIAAEQLEAVSIPTQRSSPQPRTEPDEAESPSDPPDDPEGP